MAESVGCHSTPTLSQPCLPSRLRLLCPPALPSRSLEPAEDPVQTQLHRLPNPSFYGYQDTPWQIFLRKEVPGVGEGLTRGRGVTQIGE